MCAGGQEGSCPVTGKSRAARAAGFLCGALGGARPAKRLKHVEEEAEGSSVVELLYGDSRRSEAGIMVCRLICTDKSSRELYQREYSEAFARDTNYRVFGALDQSGALVGGCAFLTLRDGLYLEFLGALPGSHAGSALMTKLVDTVRSDKKLRYIVLNAVQPSANDNAMHAFGWYMSRGFAPLASLPVLELLSFSLGSKAKKALTVEQFHKRSGVPLPAAGTSSMVRVVVMPRPDGQLKGRGRPLGRPPARVVQGL